VPGNLHPLSAYLARGTGHDDWAHYSEEPEVWEAGMLRLKKKFNTARNLVPAPVIESEKDTKIGIIAYGSTDPAVQEARALFKQKGIMIDYLRLRAVPFNDEVKKFVETHEKNYVVEVNRDGQINQILQLEYPEHADKLISIAHCDGLPLSARWIKQAIELQEVK
jgi:2-oxoglutarate ferredoxin oxidoreductase subunit alpha